VVSKEHIAAVSGIDIGKVKYFKSHDEQKDDKNEICVSKVIHDDVVLSDQHLILGTFVLSFWHRKVP